MCKRITALVLSAALCLGVLAAGDWKASEAPGDLEDFLDQLSGLTAAYEASARILVKCSGVLDPQGAGAHLRWEDWHVLQYRTADQAQAAQQAYLARGYAVDVDHVVTACAEENEGFYSWGYGQDYVNIQALQQRILDRVGGDAAQLPQILVGVVDSGLDDSNALFAGRVVAGYDAVRYDETTEEGTYHGTHVASTIAEGTLDNVKIMPIKVLGSDGRGYYSTFVFGMRYAVEHGCRVVNLSLGDICYFDSTHDAFVEVVQEGREQGVVFCVAAGNFSSDADDYCPANVEGVITVAAHDASRQVAYNSNTGSCVDITAPGVSVLGAYRDGTMAALSGTSMATPHVSAVCALILSYDQTLTSQEVQELICQNAAPSEIQGGGAGLLCATGIFAEETPGTSWETPDAGWYFEFEAENAAWDGSGGWEVASTQDVTVLQGSHSMASQGTGEQLVSPSFTAGEAVSFLAGKSQYDAQAGELAVCVSTDGGATFDQPIAVFPINAVLQMCRVELGTYTGQQIRLGFRQQGCEEGATVILDAVELYGGSMGSVTVTFLSTAAGDPIAVETVPGGACLTEAAFPALEEYEDRAFCGWDYNGDRLYEDLTVTAWYSDPYAVCWDFETDPQLSGWTSWDKDGDGSDWYWYQAQEDEDIPEGTGMMSSYSYINESLDPDNWLISPLFVAGEQVSFCLSARSPFLTRETVGFYLSTDGGQTWSEELGYFMAEDEIQTFTVDTAEYMGQHIKIAFRHYNDPRQSAVGIDQVKILGQREAPVSVSLWLILAGAGAAVLLTGGILTVKRRKGG